MEGSTFSAPGKILWIGGYSVLERPNVSFVTGVDKRVYARARPAEKIRLTSKQFNFDVKGRFENGKLQLETETPAAKFVASATQATLAYLAKKGTVHKPFHMETVSDPAFGVEDKAGLGSSAAVTVATVSALLDFHGIDPRKNRDLVFKLAQYAHSDAQGGKVGSGFDIAAAAYGASHYVRFSPKHITERPFPENIDEKWDHETGEVPLPKDFRVVVAKIIGQSASTSEMVKKINAWKAVKPDEYKQLMSGLDAINREAINSLREPKKLEAFRNAFEKGRVLTKELGEKSGAPIETAEHTELIEQCQKNGAFVAKLPGAGGGDSIAAICLNEADEKRLRSFMAGYKKVPVKPLELRTSNEGLRQESEKTFEQMAREA